MQAEHSYSLAPHTSFKVGGEASKAIIISEIIQFQKAVELYGEPDWILGYGSNSMISDKGLDGITFLIKGGDISIKDTTIIADAGVWWDDLVRFAIDHTLWGLECTSQIPGSVGAAVVGNIAAYGQAVSDTLLWAEIYDKSSGEIRKWQASELGFVYRASQTLQQNRNLIVLRAGFQLHTTNQKPLEYESALVHAREKDYDITTLDGVRQAIIAARTVAGSLWNYQDEHASKTAGSFFRNPLVDKGLAEKIMSFDETGTSLELLKKMNSVHSGESSRVSAAHVLLAAGFKRGQSWGNVRLHPQHVLKIENANNATAQEIYDVAQEIIQTVKNKLGVTIEPEVRFLGEFNDHSAKETTS
jgi:UDP-N-acetylmuramate dehydrogenase